jgi:hypothetical protein
MILPMSFNTIELNDSTYEFNTMELYDFLPMSFNTIELYDFYLWV